jgi:hypothetical protein
MRALPLEHRADQLIDQHARDGRTVPDEVQSAASHRARLLLAFDREDQASLTPHSGLLRQHRYQISTGRGESVSHRADKKASSRNKLRSDVSRTLTRPAGTSAVLPTLFVGPNGAAGPSGILSEVRDGRSRQTRGGRRRDY